MSKVETSKCRRKLSVPLVLIVIIVAVTAIWAGLTLTGRSIEKPSGTQAIADTAQGLRDFQTAGAVNPGTIAADAAEGQCTLAVFCHTAAARGMAALERWQGIVPAGGVILPRVTVTFRQGESVFDILERELRTRGIQLDSNGLAGMQYVQGIHNLYELDGGPDSGWMYSVNGRYLDYGCGQYEVQQGDAIEWNYTCDLGRDLGVDWTLR